MDFNQDTFLMPMHENWMQSPFSCIQGQDKLSVD